MWLSSLIYPATCVLCGAPGHSNMDLCPSCYADLPFNLTPCQRCGQPLPTVVAVGVLCGECLNKPPPYDNCIMPLLYAKTVPHLIKGLKFNGRLAYARVLGEILAAQVTKDWSINSGGLRPERIIPVPLHATRLRERGFNQAHEIAYAVAKQRRIPIDNTCIRVRATPPQTTLSAAERRSNLQGAFAITRALPACVAVVDDVVTTGSTIREITQTLKNSGVQRVEIWAVARTRG